jgi:transposase
MAKFELNIKIKKIIENFLNFSNVDQDFKEKLENLIIREEDYIEFEDIKKIQLINNKQNEGLSLSRLFII